jgi:hypothetical protein
MDFPDADTNWQMHLIVSHPVKHSSLCWNMKFILLMARASLRRAALNRLGLTSVGSFSSLLFLSLLSPNDFYIRSLNLRKIPLFVSVSGIEASCGMYRSFTYWTSAAAADRCPAVVGDNRPRQSLLTQPWCKWSMKTRVFRLPTPWRLMMFGRHSINNDSSVCSRSYY